MHNIRLAYGNGLRQDIWAEFQQRFKIPKIIEFYGATESPVAFVNYTNKVGACGRCSPLLVSFKEGFVFSFTIFLVFLFFFKEISNRFSLC